MGFVSPKKPLVRRAVRAWMDMMERGVPARRSVPGFIGLETLEPRTLLSAELSLTPTGGNFTTVQQNGQTVVQVAAGATIHFTAAISQTDNNNIEAFQLDFSNSDVGAGKLSLSNWAADAAWSPSISIPFVGSLSDTDISDDKVLASTSGSGHGVSTLGTFDVTVPNQAGQWQLTPDVPGKLSGITLSGTALVSDIVISFSPSADFVNVDNFGNVLLQVLPSTLPTVSVGNASITEGNNPAVTTVSLNGTVRDFIGTGTTSPNQGGAVANPDFESSAGLNYRIANPGVVVPGAVASTLGNNGLPVFVGGTTFTNSTNFNQWYTDTPSVNESEPLTLNLTSDGQNYTFTGMGSDAGEFYPIDNALFGNTFGATILGDPVPPDHNWNFTYDAHSTFVYEPGQTISITSDDDAWLFINNQLATDRGGVNIAIPETANLDTLGLTPGQQYSFDLFYAERHTVDAVLQIQTNIPLGVAAADQPTFADVDVSLSAPSPVSTIVNFATADGTAIAGTDYVATSGTLTFAPGQTTQTVRVPIIGNTTSQSDRSFSVVLSSPTNATIATGTGTTTITDDDAVTPPALTDTINLAQGQSASTSDSPINYTVVFSAPVTDFNGNDVTLGGTAGATTAVVTGSGATYNIAVSGMTQSGTVIATINAGVAHDGNNTANNASTSTDNTVTFNQPAPVLNASAEITSSPVIQLDSGPPSVIGLSNNNTESVSYNYTLTLNNTGNTTIGTFWYAWTPGKDFMPDMPTDIVSPTGWSALVTHSGSGDGYAIQWTANSADDDLAPGQSLATFQFNSVDLPAQIGGNSPFYSSTPVSTSFVYVGQPEADPGFQFVVANQFDLTHPTVTVNPAAGQLDPTSTSPIDFTVTFSKPVTDFTAGDLSLTGTSVTGTLAASVTPLDDTTYEVAINGMTGSGNVVIAVPAGVAHDDLGNPNDASTGSNSITFNKVTAPNPTVSVTASDPNASESTRDPGVFTIQLDQPATSDTTVSYELDGTAQIGKDYLIPPGFGAGTSDMGTVTFHPGDTSATVTITPKDAHLTSGSKTVEIIINAGQGFILNGNESNAIVTIADDDVAPPPATPDLTVAFALTQIVPTSVVPGDSVTVKGTVDNSGGTGDAVGPITVNAYILPADQALPNGDQPVATATIKSTIAAGASAPFSIKVPVPGTIPAGSYHLVFVVTPVNGETNTSNNSIASPAINLALALGAVDGHKAVTKLTVDGIGYAYAGPGTVTVVPGQNGQPDAVQVAGTTSKSSLTITAPKGTSKTFGDITISGSAKALNLANITLAGDVTVDGTVATLKLGNVSGGQHIDITGVDPTGKLTLALTAGTVSDLSVNSSIPIKSVSVAGWDNTDATPDVITAPSIGTISSKADFEANVNVSSLAAKASLGTVSAKGILESIIQSVGTINSITAGRIVNSLILVGVNPAANLTGLPVDGTVFVAAGASIGKVTATGIKNDPNPSFVNSDIVAPTVGTVSLKDVTTVNGGVKFGVAAHLIKSLSRTGKPTVKNLNSTANLGDNDVDGDFVLRIV